MEHPKPMSTSKSRTTVEPSLSPRKKRRSSSRQRNRSNLKNTRRRQRRRMPSRLLVAFNLPLRSTISHKLPRTIRVTRGRCCSKTWLKLRSITRMMGRILISRSSSSTKERTTTCARRTQNSRSMSGSLWRSIRSKRPFRNPRLSVSSLWSTISKKASLTTGLMIFAHNTALRSQASMWTRINCSFIRHHQNKRSTKKKYRTTRRRPPTPHKSWIAPHTSNQTKS